MPVIVLPARDTDPGKVRSLHHYLLTKPFDTEELAARIRTLLRGVTHAPPP